MADAKLKAPKPRTAAIPLGRWFGIDVGADWSWMIIFLLVTLSLTGRLPGGQVAWSTVETWTFALATSVLFFLSIILHELGHSLVAIRLGVPVRSITLFMFGGVALMEREPSRPRDEALIALAGPAVSLLLGVLFGAVFLLLGTQSLVGVTAMWLSGINLSLALFNLVPGFPLDGGRVLRAVLWTYKGDLTRATTWAAGVGSVVAYGLMGWGVFAALFQNNVFQGLWLAFIGWFLLGAARSSAVHVMAQEVLSKIPVSEIMDTACETVSPGSSLEHVVDTGVLRRGQRCFLVARDGAFHGLLTIGEITNFPRDEWPVTSVQAAMVDIDELETAAPETSLFEALQLMDGVDVNQLPIVRDGDLVGVLTRDRLLAVMRNQLELRR